MQKKKKVYPLIAAAVLVVAVGGYAATVFQPESFKQIKEQIAPTPKPVKKQPILDCGFPQFDKNQATGELHDPNFDLIFAIAMKSEAKLSFHEGIGTRKMQTDLQPGKTDFLCHLVIQSARRLQEVDFSTPIAGLPLFLYVREKDDRFNSDPSLANNADIKVATSPIGPSEVMTEEHLPAATQVAIPPEKETEGLFEAVVQKKADAVIETEDGFTAFAKKHPHTLRAAGGKPFVIVPLAFPIAKNSPETKEVLDRTIRLLQQEGFMDQLAKKFPEDTKYWVPADQIPGTKAAPEKPQEKKDPAAAP